MKLLIFGGTTEGRLLTVKLARLGYDITVCVATDYGAELLPDQPGIQKHIGRLDRQQMLAWMQKGDYGCVIDATHPYALEVTRNILQASHEADLPYYRVLRNHPQDEGAKTWIREANAGEAAKRLASLTSAENILLTTGIKDLHYFAPLNREGQRLYVRVLPSLASMESCLRLGIPSAQIICMQGPFSEEMNLAILRQLNISLVVTKASGPEGGFREKAAAAKKMGIPMLVIDRPGEEKGLSLEAMIRQIRKDFPNPKEAGR